MKTLRSFLPCAVLACVVLAGVAPARDADSEKVLIDFTVVNRDPDGKVFRSYEYAWEDWNKHIIDLRGRGTLIQTPSGKGALGENNTMLGLGKATAVDLQFVIGNGNQTAAISFGLEDKDGTEQSWTIHLAGQPKGQLIRARLDLTKKETEAKPGSTPGLNLKKIYAWQIKGDWQPPKVEILLVKLTAAK